MKKIVSLILAILMVAAVATACAPAESTNNDNYEKETELQSLLSQQMLIMQAIQRHWKGR